MPFLHDVKTREGTFGSRGNTCAAEGVKGEAVMNEKYEVYHTRMLEQFDSRKKMALHEEGLI